MAKIVVDNSRLTPHIEDQKEEGVSYAFAMADMVSTCYRMKHKRNKDENTVVLSTQPLIDMLIKGNGFTVLKDPKLGLQTIEAYPVARTTTVAKATRYNDSQPRYIVTDGDIYFADEDILKGNFGEGGFGYPIVATLKMGKLWKSDVARKHYEDNKPFSHFDHDNKYLKSLDTEVNHAVLIVGYNENMGSCIIKNTWGSKWGYNGLTLAS